MKEDSQKQWKITFLFNCFADIVDFGGRKTEKNEKAEKICQKGLTGPEKFANINIHDLE